MKKFILISCLALFAVTAMAAELRQSAPPENDVGCIYEMPTIFTENFMNFGLQEFQWLGTINAAEDCTMPTQVSTEVVKTAETSVQVRLAEFRWPNTIKFYITEATLPYYHRARVSLAAKNYMDFRFRSAI